MSGHMALKYSVYNCDDNINDDMTKYWKILVSISISISYNSKHTMATK